MIKLRFERDSIRQEEDRQRALTPWAGMTSLKQEMDGAATSTGASWTGLSIPPGAEGTGVSPAGVIWTSCHLDRFFEPKWDEFVAVGEWAPSIDLIETKDALMAKVEVPGMGPKDIQVSLQEQLLTIKGEKRHEKEEKDEKDEKDERHHRIERSYGAFTRAVRLPVAIHSGKVTAAFKNGVLTITLPKTPAAKGSTIPIKAE